MDNIENDDKLAYASWSISLMVDCPHCGKYVNLLDSYLNSEGLEPGEVFGGDKQDVICPDCKEEFECEFTF